MRTFFWLVSGGVLGIVVGELYIPWAMKTIEKLKSKRDSRYERDKAILNIVASTMSETGISFEQREKFFHKLSHHLKNWENQKKGEV